MHLRPALCRRLPLVVGTLAGRVYDTKWSSCAFLASCLYALAPQSTCNTLCIAHCPYCSKAESLVPPFRWRSFYRGGSLSFYMALYAIGFLFSTLHLLNGFLSSIVYLCYMVLILWAVYLSFGTVGFLSSFLFTYKIFASVKAD